jgi:cytochrome b561
MWKNTTERYGWIAILLHWLTAIAVIGLFGLGWYMTSLTYYDPFYKTGPHIHKSIGVLLFALVLARLLWRVFNPQPALPAHSPSWEHVIAKLTHALLYLLLIAIMISGYLISTANGLEIAVFNWFDIPALPWAVAQQEELAGDVHQWLAWLLMALVVLHTLAALKHHFYDKDSVLTRMLGLKTR